jgi:hypothetical protein
VTADGELTDDEPPEHRDPSNHSKSSTRTPRTHLRRDVALF